MALPVEFSLEALAVVDDVVATARRLTREAHLGRIVCGQADPRLRELTLGDLWIMVRLERDHIYVLEAEILRSPAH